MMSVVYFCRFYKLYHILKIFKNFMMFVVCFYMSYKLYHILKIFKNYYDVCGIFMQVFLSCHRSHICYTCVKFCFSMELYTFFFFGFSGRTLVLEGRTSTSLTSCGIFHVTTVRSEYIIPS